MSVQPAGRATRRAWAWLLLAILGAAAAGTILSERLRGPSESAREAAPALEDGAREPPGRFGGGPEGIPASRFPRTIRWIAFGGGADPASSQVSLEQDLELARGVLRDDGTGVLLHAGGPGTASVQLLVEDPPAPDLARRVSDLFDPRETRDATYRASRLAPLGGATRENVVRALEAALTEDHSWPLVFYAAAHGEGGEEPRDSVIHLWGGDTLSVVDLAQVLDRAPSPRPVQLVVTSCFGGGFAELAFLDADSRRGPSPRLTCGFFATTWDDEASGCDPDPDRRLHEGYGIHYWNALAGRDRAGAPLPLSVLDLDGDGQVSPYEAHTRARIAARSIDVPTSVSERFLRAHAPTDGPVAQVSLPEEEAVVRALGEALGLADPVAVGERLAALERELADLDEELADQEASADERWARLRIALLERWPVLDDPAHPELPALLATEGEAIDRAISSSPEALAYEDARGALTRSGGEYDRAVAQYALVRRLSRAVEDVALAARLAARGGEDYGRYRALLACERGAFAE